MPAIDTAPKDRRFLGWNGLWRTAWWVANAREGGAGELLSDKMEPFNPPLTDWTDLPAPPR